MQWNVFLFLLQPDRDMEWQTFFLKPVFKKLGSSIIVVKHHHYPFCENMLHFEAVFHKQNKCFKITS